MAEVHPGHKLTGHKEEVLKYPVMLEYLCATTFLPLVTCMP
jgi:hypothetical protein